MMARLVYVLFIVLMIGSLMTAQAQEAGRADGAVQLTAPEGSLSDQNPAFSPDGALLIFTRFYEGYNDGPSEVLVLDYAGGAAAAIITEAGTDNVNMPGTSWSPITERITFSSDRLDTDEIWTATVDGGTPTRVTVTIGGTASEPTFSPDGEWIAYQALDEDDDTGAIWMIRADGSAATQLTPGVDFDDRQPNWSPLENRILFQRRVPGSDNWDIYSINPTTQAVRQITKSEGSDTDASWSPDGAWIVYSSTHGDLEFANIYIQSSLGGTPIRVTDNPDGYDGAPSWSPDFKWLVFESGAEDEPTTLWAIPTPQLPGRAAGALPDITLVEG